MQIFKNLEEHIEHIALVLLTIVFSMAAYFLTSPQPPRERTKSAFAGGVKRLHQQQLMLFKNRNN